MSKVLVIDTLKRPLDPIHSAKARQLLNNGRAAIFRRFPFTIVLKESLPDQTVQPLRLKIDPGAEFTGIAIINDTTGEVVWAAELQPKRFCNQRISHLPPTVTQESPEPQNSIPSSPV